MKLQTRSILQELNEFGNSRNREKVLESRATHIINSAINLIETIYKTYDKEQASELERRLINSIKGQDSSKFTRGIRKITENTKNQTSSSSLRNQTH